MAKIKDLRGKLETVRREVNAAVEHGDAQTVNTLGPQEHLLEDQLLEAMKIAKAAGDTGFNRPISQPQPSPAPEIKVETPPGFQRIPIQRIRLLQLLRPLMRARPHRRCWLGSMNGINRKRLPPEIL